MSTLILPVAGRSSRFPNMRPKWLLTMPSGKLMFEEAVANLHLHNFTRIVITCLKEHVENFVNLKKLEASAQQNISAKIEFCILENPTNSHSETIYETIKRMHITGNIYLKDCDNTFAVEYLTENSVATVSLNAVELIDAKNKSYVTTNELGIIDNIVEKSVISSEFCCGGYSFEKAEEFVSTFEKLRTRDANMEWYISHIIFQMMLDGKSFRTHAAEQYVDWGTLREYRHVARKKITVFCDIDGVLLINGSKFGAKGWNTDAITENVNALIKLQRQDRLYLVLTTSRPKSEEIYVQRILKQLGLTYDQAVWGLPHTKRVMVNDFSPSNPYPSAISINLHRDATTLDQYLEHLEV